MTNSASALGRHACRFYESTQNLFEIVVPFLKAGLKRREALIWVHPDFVSPGSIGDALRAARIDPEELMGSGQLELIEGASWYLSADGALKDIPTLLAQWKQREDRVLARGFSGLRVTGDASFTLETGDFLLFLEYEKTVHGVIASTLMTALCTYGLSALGSKVQRDAIEGCHDPENRAATRRPW